MPDVRRRPKASTAGGWLVLCAACAAATAEGLSDPQRQELAALKLQAAGEDFDRAVEAVERIGAMGAAAREDLRILLRQLLTRNAYAIDAAAKAAGPEKPFALARKQLHELRAEALANIARLSKDDDSIPKAEAYSKDLIDRTRRITPKLAVRSRLLDAAVQRMRLLALAKRFGVAEAPTSTAATDPLRRAGEVLGVSLAKADSADELLQRGELADLRSYRLNRRIQEHNQRVAQSMHAEEARNVLTVNDYREALGLLRLEIDPRLVQSARRHAREMVDLGYFSHESPTAGLRTCQDRMKAAGYPAPGGENIAAGRQRGVEVFAMWFRSPGHHQNMARPTYTAVGVGKWSDRWVQNLGQAPRLAFAPPAARAAAQPKGPLLPRGR